MKKLYLSITLVGIFILMFAITMIPTKAYTFNGSYDFSNIDLNVSLTELNGASLNDLFDYDYLETLPLIEWNGFRNKYEVVNGSITFNEYIYIDLDYKNLFDGDLELGSIDLSNGTLLSNTVNYRTVNYIQVKESQTYTLSTEHVNNIGIIEYDNNFNFVTSYILATSSRTFTTNSSTRYVKYFANISNFTNINYPSQLEEGDLSTDYVPFGVLTEVYRLNTPAISNNDLVQSLYLYNLENINIDLLNYYFAVFLLNAYDLPVGDLWSYAYNAGENFGYNNGYGIGYNEGMDYAATNNISLLSVFQLIIGVVMSMLGFIINIELFGISIASVLGTLAIGIAIIWTLKLIRG